MSYARTNRTDLEAKKRKKERKAKREVACPSLPGLVCWHHLVELEKRMPHERPRQLAHPSSLSFHTLPAPSTKGTFHTK